MIYIAIHKVLTYFFQYGDEFEIQNLDIFVNLKKVSMIVFNTIYICYNFQSLLIFFTVSISLVMEYFIFHKVIIYIIMLRLHTRLPHPF